MKKILFLTAAVMSLSACGEDSRLKAQRAAQSYGFHNVVIGDFDTISCSQDDVFGYDFTAYNVNNQIVHGVVCLGWPKGSTVRITDDGGDV